MKILNPKAKESQQQEYEKQKAWLENLNAGENPVGVRIKILQSNLWQSISDFLPEKKRAEVLMALQTVYLSNSIINLDSDNIDVAMTWEQTPQGHDYWADLHYTTVENGL